MPGRGEALTCLIMSSSPRMCDSEVLAASLNACSRQITFGMCKQLTACTVHSHAGVTVQAC